MTPDEDHITFNPPAVANFRDAATKVLARIMSQRNEILEAFVAKYGFDPDRTVQVEQRMRDETTRWYVRQMTDEEIDQRPHIKKRDDL